MGPEQIDDMRARIDAKLEAGPAVGKSPKETNAATMNRHPAPESIAEAEVKLGDISARTVQTVGEAMVRARKADQTGDMVGCEQALAEVNKALGH